MAELEYLRFFRSKTPEVVADNINQKYPKPIPTGYNHD